ARQKSLALMVAGQAEDGRFGAHACSYDEDYESAGRSAMPNPDEVAHWENRYRERPPWDTGRVSAELRRRLGQFPIPRGRAVELGCGTGTNAIWLAQQGFDVTAVDISPTAIAAAQAKAME